MSEKLGLSPSELTPEQLAELEAGPGRVVSRAELASRRELNSLGNYWLHFGDGISAMYRETPHYKRFEIIYPELADVLLDKVHLFRTGVGGTFIDLTLLEEVDQTYDIMCELVDENDPYVKQTDGTVDRLFLTR